MVSGNIDEIMDTMGRRAKITIGFLADEDLQNGVVVMRTNDLVGEMVRKETMLKQCLTVLMRIFQNS